MCEEISWFKIKLMPVAYLELTKPYWQQKNEICTICMFRTLYHWANFEEFLGIMWMELFEFVQQFRKT